MWRPFRNNKNITYILGKIPGIMQRLKNENIYWTKTIQNKNKNKPIWFCDFFKWVRPRKQPRCRFFGDPKFLTQCMKDNIYLYFPRRWVHYWRRVWFCLAGPVTTTPWQRTPRCASWRRTVASCSSSAGSPWCYRSGNHGDSGALL